MSNGGRRVVVQLLKNFWSSITTKRNPGREVGRDNFGNKYFEIPADPSRGKRRPSRWFEPLIKENFTADMPAEWEAWLRGRRAFPPTQEEVAYNQALMESKKQKAALLDKAFREEQERRHLGEVSHQNPTSSFPLYDDYEQEGKDAQAHQDLPEPPKDSQPK
uniref:NADH dehydrogenase [ubiquinone] 1 alpha subcomplex subunit 12 n=1 Tax=Amblyomma maculatum TaxID=34609 RepID=G3MQ45_AMBMU